MPGAAGDVSVVNSGRITTADDQSTAIFAQSIGGGGGDGGTTGGVITIGGAGNSGGDAGTVSVTQGGQINTSGIEAMGIFAQSVGGGGGNGGAGDSGSLELGLSLGGDGANGGQGGDSTVMLDSYSLMGSNVPSIISTSGEGATGILSQSVGGGGGNGGDRHPDHRRRGRGHLRRHRRQGRGRRQRRCRHAGRLQRRHGRRQRGDPGK